MTLDPITLEVIENRLTEIGWEGGITLQKTAASPSTVEAKDMGFNISDHLGRTIVYSTWMPRHGTTLAFMLQACRRRFREEEIAPGDVFLTNNPHDGALHNLDIAVFAPVHYDGEIIAWTGCATHHLDIGGITPGRSPEATNWFQEGLIFRPIKLVERGALRDDLFQFFLDNVRMPRYQGLDLKAQIAAIHVAKERVLEVVARYGAPTLRACYEEFLTFGEQKARERTRQLAPGRYEAEEFIDYDRLYKLRCALTVQDDTLTFDFSGTEPESKTFINAGLACTVANVHNIVVCQLLPDVNANEGCFRPVRVMVPEGSLLNCRPPAACSGASTITGWKAQALAIATLSQALERSPLWERASAAWGSAFIDIQISGLDPLGRWFTVRTGESLQGGGARAIKDGMDISNILGSTNTSIPNVEFMEQRFPIMYLKRGFCPDSGGPGRHRGGLGAEYVVKLHGVPEADLTPFYIGRERGAPGYAGGGAGSTSVVKIKRNSDVEARLREGVSLYEEIESPEAVLPQKNAPSVLRQDDVIYARFQGGGGYGDPLEREPERVRQDVVEGYVSLAAAREAYGVVIHPETLEVDAEVTAALRRSLRQKEGSLRLEQKGWSKAVLK